MFIIITIIIIIIIIIICEQTALMSTVSLGNALLTARDGGTTTRRWKADGMFVV